MRVVAKKPLIEQILDAIEIIEKDNREVDYIELTEDERDEIKRTFYPYLFHPSCCFKPNTNPSKGIYDHHFDRLGDLKMLMGHPVRIVE